MKNNARGHQTKITRLEAECKVARRLVRRSGDGLGTVGILSWSNLLCTCKLFCSIISKIAIWQFTFACNVFEETPQTLHVELRHFKNLLQDKPWRRQMILRLTRISSSMYVVIPSSSGILSLS